MTARAIASGNISFGLVSIPIKMYSASDPSGAVSFNLLHAKCGSRLKQQYICPKEDEIVTRDQMVKGYEFSKDRYVTFTTEELKALEEQSTQTIDVVEFIPVTAIDPVYFDKSYYLGPDKGGGKAYRLLAEALKSTGRVALAKFAARGKQYVVMLRPVDEGLVMQQLLYAGEVRPFSEVPLEPGEVKDSELQLARMLIEQRSAESFRPETYEDDVAIRIREQLQRKIDGEEISAAPPEPGGAQIIDLMEALKASLAKGGRSGSPHQPAPRAEGAKREPTMLKIAEPPAAMERRPAKRAVRSGARKAKSSKE